MRARLTGGDFFRTRPTRECVDSSPLAEDHRAAQHLADLLLAANHRMRFLLITFYGAQCVRDSAVGIQANCKRWTPYFPLERR